VHRMRLGEGERSICSRYFERGKRDLKRRRESEFSRILRATQVSRKRSSPLVTSGRGEKILVGQKKTESVSFIETITLQTGERGGRNSFNFGGGKRKKGVKNYPHLCSTRGGERPSWKKKEEKQSQPEQGEDGPRLQGGRVL